MIVLGWTAFMHLVFLGINFGIGKAMRLSDPILKVACCRLNLGNTVYVDYGPSAAPMIGV